MVEIGSEFWLSDGRERGGQLCHNDSTIYLLSGRTALDYIIQDIKATSQFSSIAMPSYCCGSMIEPFIRNDVTVIFYDVMPYDDGIKSNYNPSDAADAVLLLDYFGYANPALPRLAEQAKASGKIVIYDGTHKLNGNNEVKTFVDYTFCSYRKWFFSNAASATKNAGRWNLDSPSVLRNTRYETLRNEAARLKRDYVNGKPVDKREFLRHFTEAEKLLDSDYVGYAAEVESVERIQHIDIRLLAEGRRKNAQRLLDGLCVADLPWLSIPYETVRNADCPLFLPVLVEHRMRDAIRRKLIEHSIYCPIHWPLSEQHCACGIKEHEQRLYQTELSLICDQRYGLSDMDRIVETLKTIGDTI